MGTSARYAGERKELLQTGLKIRQKYFLQIRFHHVNVVPGTDGILNLFALVCIYTSL